MQETISRNISNVTTMINQYQNLEQVYIFSWKLDNYCIATTVPFISVGVLIRTVIFWLTF